MVYLLHKLTRNGKYIMILWETDQGRISIGLQPDISKSWRIWSFLTYKDKHCSVLWSGRSEILFYDGDIHIFLAKTLGTLCERRHMICLLYPWSDKWFKGYHCYSYMSLKSTSTVSSWMFVCLYPINVQTTEPMAIRPKFCVGSHITLQGSFTDDPNFKS